MREIIDVGTTKRGTMSRMRRLRIFEAHGGRCVLCKRKIYGVREKWIVEHILALLLGGKDENANCGPAHESCRREKDKIDVAAGAKCKRMKARHLGIKKSRSSLSHPTLKRRMDGSVVAR